MASVESGDARPRCKMLEEKVRGCGRQRGGHAYSICFTSSMHVLKGFSV